MFGNGHLPCTRSQGSRWTTEINDMLLKEDRSSILGMESLITRPDVQLGNVNTIVCTGVYVQISVCSALCNNNSPLQKRSVEGPASTFPCIKYIRYKVRFICSAASYSSSLHVIDPQSTTKKLHSLLLLTSYRTDRKQNQTISQ